MSPLTHVFLDDGLAICIGEFVVLHTGCLGVCLQTGDAEEDSNRACTILEIQHQTVSFLGLKVTKVKVTPAMRSRS